MAVDRQQVAQSATEEGTRAPLLGFFGVIAEPAAWKALSFLLLSLITGTTYFTWAITGLSLSAGLLVLIIGLPFLGVFLLSARGLANGESWLVESLLGTRLSRRPLMPAAGPGAWTKFKALFTDRYSWRSILYMVLMLPLGIVYFTVFITAIALSLGAIALPIAQLFGVPAFTVWDTQYFLPWWLNPALVLGGVLGMVLVLHLARAVGKLHAGLAKAMLS